MSRDKTLLALGSHDGSIHLYNINTGKTHILSQGTCCPAYLKFSADGQFLLATYANGTALCWDLKTGIAQKIVGTNDTIIDKAHCVGDCAFILVEEKTKNSINLYDIQKNIPIS